jgi:hypothetical protein
MEEMTNSDKPKIKLLTLWKLDDHKQIFYSKPDDSVISHGIWETSGVELTDKGRLYTMTCRLPGHKSQNIGDEIKMYDWLLIEMCHEVKICSLPKLPSMIPRLKMSNDQKDLKPSDDLHLLVNKWVHIAAPKVIDHHFTFLKDPVKISIDSGERRLSLWQAYLASCHPEIKVTQLEA